MTCCVGVIADDGKSIVLVGDREVSLDWVAAEPDVQKIEPLGAGWWACFSGPISACIDILDRARRDLPKGDDLGKPHKMAEAVRKAFFARRDDEAESLFLLPHGWSLKDFRDSGRHSIDESVYTQMDYSFAAHRLNASFLIAGFDPDGVGHLLGVDFTGVQWFDKPGFHAIGSGSYGAIFLMYYREMGRKTKLREAAYYAYEGKYFGEFSPTVGLDTDLVILRPGADPVWINPDYDEQKGKSSNFLKVAWRLSPGPINKAERDLLNSIEELNAIGCEPIENVDEKTRKQKQAARNVEETAGSKTRSAK